MISSLNGEETVTVSAQDTDTTDGQKNGKAHSQEVSDNMLL